VVRCLPGEDKTNGFFVACFIKGGSQAKKSFTSRKRTREEVEVPEEQVAENTDSAKLEQTEAKSEATAVSGAKSSVEPREKTAAQMARKRRKKQAQKAKQAAD
jgi:putative methyltransferase